MVKENTMAPSFTLEGSDGKTHSLEDFRGKRVVLYFYPKDSTPGCTKEACSLRDAKIALEEKGAVIIGISKDSVSSHNKFIEKQGLNFLLLSDPNHAVMESYGAWGEKIMYGKKTEGCIRSTFIIGPDGIITKVFGKVSVNTHGEDVLAVI